MNLKAKATSELVEEVIEEILVVGIARSILDQGRLCRSLTGITFENHTVDGVCLTSFLCDFHRLAIAPDFDIGHSVTGILHILNVITVLVNGTCRI